MENVLLLPIRLRNSAFNDDAVDWILANFTVQPPAQADFLRARTLSIKDFEDAVVATVADSAHCQYIITRNISDFKNSPVEALTPEEFLLMKK
ncbi:MAG: PIN domain-containing protein [Verrucomicrobiae bacterium]|nr:PIN domain-containing protein [Verrucomicrobiae bacterium]